jgi:CRP-like cAMP-binding protein
MLPKSLQVEVCGVMRLETYVRNEVIFTMGDAPDKFYIIASGKVEVCVNEVAGFRSGQFHSVAVLKAGDSFGEMALLVSGRPCAASVAGLSLNLGD